ncbi:MAG TPA: TetR/AcrR family transcriptional regulator [Kofleriaceae bacterium]|nr:TetR/AcrR family transcriptional regulator [Kofleriaceae bacterium]
MSKGEATRQAILERAFALATTWGLAGVTIGRLAEHTGLSKSGLFAHFGSKEALDVAVVQEGSRVFVESVLSPALRFARGEPRVRALFDHWLAWAEQPGGCFFVAITAELDDHDGPARVALEQATKDWIDALATAARIAVAEGHFRKDLDVLQFAFQAYSVMLGAHLYARFLRDDNALLRTRRAIETLIAASRP